MIKIDEQLDAYINDIALGSLSVLDKGFVDIDLIELFFIFKINTSDKADMFLKQLEDYLISRHYSYQFVDMRNVGNSNIHLNTENLMAIDLNSLYFVRIYLNKQIEKIDLDQLKLDILSAKKKKNKTISYTLIINCLIILLMIGSIIFYIKF